MLIALNLLYLIPGVVGGTETYAVSLIQALAREDSENEYLVYLSSEAADIDVTPAPNFRRIVTPVVAMQRAMRYAWEQAVLPMQLRSEKPALIHSLGYVIPLAASAPQVVTVHDVNFLGHSGRRTAIGRKAFGFFVEKTVKRASHIITVSEFSKREVVKYLHVDPARITAVHSAGRELTEPTAPASSLLEDIPRPYIMAFSSLSAHKNIDRLISAFAKIAPDVPHSLVLVGHLPEKGGVSATDHASIADRIIFTGFIPDADVDALLRSASLFAFPSLYEGFGLPVLDAQHAGVPVACSSAAALPEVAGEGALLFDPNSVDEMAEALKRGLLDMDLRNRLIASGNENASQYSWDRTARETLAVYAKVAS